MRSILGTPGASVNVATKYELDTRLNHLKDVVATLIVAIQVWTQWADVGAVPMGMDEDGEDGEPSLPPLVQQATLDAIKALLDDARVLRDYSKNAAAESTVFVGRVRSLQRSAAAALAEIATLKMAEREEAIRTSSTTFIAQTRLRFRGKCTDEEMLESYRDFKESLLAFLTEARATPPMLSTMDSVALLSLAPMAVEDPEEKRRRMLDKSQVEMLDTESKYFVQLRVLADLFVEPLRKDPAMTSIKALQRASFQQMLASVVSLVGLTAVFIEGLKAEMKPGRERLIGTLFSRNAPALRMYSVYVNHYDDGMEALKEAREMSSKFDAFCREFEQKANIQNVSFAFILPIQRCPRYEMLLANILKFTPSSDPESAPLQQGLAKVREVNTFINVKKRQDENRRRLSELQNVIQWSLGKPVHLNEPGVFRQHVREGLLESGRREAYYWFLLSDMLLKTTVIKSSLNLFKKLRESAAPGAVPQGTLSASSSPKRYALVAVLRFSKITLGDTDPDLPDDPCSFSVVEDDTGVVHHCTALSEDEAEQWRKGIRAGLDIHKL